MNFRVDAIGYSPAPEDEDYAFHHNGTPSIRKYSQIALGHSQIISEMTIVDHRGALLPGLYGSLAKLGMGRAYAMTGDMAKARTAYQDLFGVWKDADSDIPILKEAKAEYAKLQ
jgi:hypothetical protein